MNTERRDRVELGAAGPVQRLVRRGRKAATGARSLAGTMMTWVRADYPCDARGGHLALLALCGSDLTSSRIALIVDEFGGRPVGEITDVDLAIAIMTATDGLASPVEVQRLRAALIDGV